MDAIIEDLEDLATFLLNKQPEDFDLVYFNELAIQDAYEIFYRAKCSELTMIDWEEG